MTEASQDRGAWNIRFVLYAKAFGRTPQQMYDKGNLYLFCEWIKQRTKEFAVYDETSVFIDGNGCYHITDHDRFDEYLDLYTSRVVAERRT